MVLGILGSLLVAGGASWFLREINAPSDPDTTELVNFEISPGDTADLVADNLKKINLIRQPWLFKLMARQRNVADKLEVGTYQLQGRMTTGEILTALQEAAKVEEKTFTIIEGMRLEQIAEVMVKQNLAAAPDEVLAVLKNAEAFKATHARLKDIPAGQSLEGYVFPDTYRVLATATITDVVERILDEFDSKYAEFETSVTVEQRSIHEIVTMASIVQREAADDDEMPHLAWILWNRLKPENNDEVQGRLQADPTVQYIAGYDNVNQTWWRKNIDTFLDVDSPYNTRKNKGLPPGPISNPGLQALKSAARPGSKRPDGTDGDKDLYFVAKCGVNGTDYATNLAEFGVLEQAYLQCPNPR